MKLSLGRDSDARFGQYFDFKFSRFGDVWLRMRSKCLVKILNMKFDQDLCLNLWYEPTGCFGKLNSTVGSVVPLAMFLTQG